MPYRLSLHALPTLAAPEDLAGGTAVVIDVLRALTTIVHAIDAGVREIIPCLEVVEARSLAAEMPDTEVILGGERGGRPIAGFDLGNSPDQYTAERVGGKTLVFTTTNGTRAMGRCRLAERVWIAGLVNAAAIVERLAGRERIHLLCAGTDGQMSEDDILVGGLLVHRLQQRGDVNYRLNAQALTAWETWKCAFSLPQSLGGEPIPPARLAERLRQTPGGRPLVELGLEEDILVAARLDSFDVVPELDPRSMRIHRLA